MAKGFIFLFGEIFQDNFEGAQDWGIVGSTLVSNKLLEFSENPEITEVEVHINSPGGSLFEGMLIYDLLRASALDVTTVAMGQVGSAATLPFLAPDDPKDRFRMENASFMIHKPETFAHGNSDDMEQTKEMLEDLNERITNIYMDASGHDEDQITEWLEGEGTTWIGDAMEDAGWSGAVMEEIFAFGSNLILNKTNKKVMTKTTKKLSIVDRLQAASNSLMQASVSALELANEAGQTMSFQTENDTPEIGNVVTIDGVKPEDKDYVMANGLSITVQEGKVTAVSDPAQTGNDVAMTEVIEKLTTTVTDLSAEVKALTTNQEAFTTEWETVTNHLGNQFQLNTTKVKKDADGNVIVPQTPEERDAVMLERRNKKLGIKPTA